RLPRPRAAIARPPLPGPRGLRDLRDARPPVRRRGEGNRATVPGLRGVETVSGGPLAMRSQTMKKERLRPILIERVEPAVDDGRYPCKREVGDRLEISADIFKAGHDLLAAVILYPARAESRSIQAPIHPPGHDRQ